MWNLKLRLLKFKKIGENIITIKSSILHIPNTILHKELAMFNSKVSSGKLIYIDTLMAAKIQWELFRKYFIATKG